MGRISSQIRLAVHVVLACLRRCSADLENPSATISAAGGFQVRQQESKGLEQDTYRKSGGGAELRKAAGQHQAAVSFFGQSGCNMPGDAGGAEGELARPRPPPLCTLDHHSPSRARRVPQELRWQGKAVSSILILLVEAARVHGVAATAALRQCTSRGAARQAEPRRGSWCSRGRCGAWSGSWPSWSSPSMPITQPTRTAPSVPLLGRARGRWGPSVGCMRDCYNAKRKIATPSAT